MLQTKTIEYHDGNTLLKGHYVFDDSIAEKRPVVLVAHDWSGCNEFAREKAAKLAEMGYVGFAIDMYGDGKTGQTNEERMSLMKPLMENRAGLAERITSALRAAKKIEQADITKAAAIGFCFGGLCVLDLARSGADIKGVISFHGLLVSPNLHKQPAIKAKILALHGHDDPMVPPAQVASFQKEMVTAKVDWQMHIYGKTKHAFMNPSAHDDALGTVYNELTAKRAWVSMQNFLAELFA